MQWIYHCLKKYAYNLHHLGKKIIAKQQKEEEKNLKRIRRQLKIAA